MKTVTLQVAKLEDVKRRAQDAFKGRKQGSRISFASPEVLFRLLTAKAMGGHPLDGRRRTSEHPRSGAAGEPRC